MEPFGPGNDQPVFLARSVLNTGWSRIVKEQHVRFSVKQGSVTITGIGFGLAGKFNLLEENKAVDLVFRIEENEWNGNTSLQLKVIDLRPAETIS